MPPDKTGFFHTDGRIISHVGETLHTTRDGREITLQVWRVHCLKDGCGVAFTVRTATHTPWDWPAFSPKKYCDDHRTAARVAGMAHLVKARADGLARWRKSPEGKAALKQRRMNHMGGVELLVYETAAGLALADGAAPVRELAATVMAALPLPKGRDTRKFRVKRALGRLESKEWVKYDRVGGLVAIARVPQEKPTKKTTK